MTLDIETHHVSLQIEHAKNKPSWKCPSEYHIQEYKVLLKAMIGIIDVPYESLRCDNMTCMEHYDQINTYHNVI